MKPELTNCALVVRQLVKDSGVVESVHEVSSLEQLFDRCLSLEGEHLIERLVIEGRDGNGRSRSLVFTFQSASDRD